MDIRKGWLLLKEKEVEPITHSSFRSLQHSWNKVRFHNKFETFPHFLTKAILSKLIFNQKDSVITEYEYPSCNVIDVLQVKKNELIGYQVETGNFEEKEFYNTTVLTVDLRKCPKEVMEAFKILKNYFKRFVV